MNGPGESESQTEIEPTGSLESTDDFEALSPDDPDEPIHPRRETPEEKEERHNRVKAARERLRTAHSARHKTDRDSTEHQNQLNELRENRQSTGGEYYGQIYGADTLHQLDDPEITDDTRRILLNDERNKLTGPYGRYLTRAHQPELLKDLEHVPGVELGPHSTPEDLQETISQLSDAQLETLLRSHFARVATEIDARTPELSGLKEDFVRRLREHYASSNPELADTVAERLESFRIEFADPMEMGGILGSQQYQTGAIQLNLGLHPLLLRNTADHELLHAAAGIGVMTGSPLANREGLKIAGDKSSGRQMRFDWLNEAIVETETNELNPEEPPTYEGEIGIYQMLLSRVPKSAFLKAYYQNTDPDGGWPAWGELNHQLSEQFEPRILLTLDKLIRDSENLYVGLAAARAYLKNLPEPEPAPEPNHMPEPH